MKSVITPPTSCTTAFGVKKKPFARIFTASSNVIETTNKYSQIFKIEIFLINKFKIYFNNFIKFELLEVKAKHSCSKSLTDTPKFAVNYKG